MKSKFLICFVFTSAINFGYSQTYDLINEVFRKFEPDTIFLNKVFVNDYSFEVKSFNEYNIRDWWSPLPHPKTPSIELFLNNFDLKLLQDTMKSNQNGTLINFNKLSSRFFATSEKYRNTNARNTYFSVSKAIQNNNRDWSIIFVYSANRFYDIGGGYMQIYRKIKNQWVLYHRLQLWIS